MFGFTVSSPATSLKGTGFAGASEQGLWEFLQQRRVDFVVIFPNWYPRLSERPELQEKYRVRLKHNVICGGDEMVVYRVRWDGNNRVSLSVH